MSSALNGVNGPTYQIARFPEKSAHRKKLFERHKSVVAKG